MLQKAEPVRFTSPFAPYTGTPTITFLEPPAELTPPAIPSETATDSASQPREIEAGHTGTSEATTSAITAGTAQTREHLLALRRLCRETLGGESPFLEPALASYIANMRLDGSVVWLLMVAPPSSGKTLVIHLLAELPSTLEADDISFAGLMSGTRRADRAEIATGGLLREVDRLGGKAVILGSDLTQYLFDEQGKHAIMGAFRLVCDGRMHRAHGSDGGSRDGWNGRVGFIGGITGMVDGSFAIRNSMGERFLYLRSSQTFRESWRRAMSAERMTESEREARLREGVDALIGTIALKPVVPFSDSVRQGITSLATMVGMLRTTIPRNSYVGAATAAAERPARLNQQLTSLYNGFRAIGCTADEAWTSLQKVAKDSILPIRIRVFEQLLVKPGEPVPTPRIADALGMKPTDPMINRILHNFAALGLVEDVDPRETRNSWVLTPEAYEICRYAFTEDSPEPSSEDISAIVDGDATVPLLPEVSTAEAEAAPLVAEADDLPPGDDLDAFVAGESQVQQPPLMTSSPEYRADLEGPVEISYFDVRQPE